MLILPLGGLNVRMAQASYFQSILYGACGGGDVIWNVEMRPSGFGRLNLLRLSPVGIDRNPFAGV